MKTGLLLFGFLFLINPELITLDLLPDLIGFLLIAKGLEKFAHLEDRIFTARRWAFVLAISSALKILSSVLVISSTTEATRLTVSFVFFVADLWLSWVFADNLLKGVQYLAVRRGGEGTLKGYEVVRGFVLAFFVVKHVCHFLPQGLAALYPNIDADGNLVENYREMVSEYQFIRSILFIAGSVVLLVFGIYTFRVIAAYLRRLKKDETFCQNLLSDYNEKVGHNENALVRVAVRGAFFRFFIALIFVFDLYSEGMSLLPQPLFALFAFWGLHALRATLKPRRCETVLRHVCLWGVLLSFVYRVVCLFVMNPFEATFALFPLTPVFAVISQLCSFGLILFMMLSTGRVAARFTAQSFRVKGIVITVAAALLLAEGIFAYIGILTPLFAALGVWVLYALILYLYKDTSDQIRAEVEYKLM